MVVSALRRVMEWMYQQRCYLKEFCSHCNLRSLLLRFSMFCLLVVLCVSMYPGLWSVGVQLHSVVTGSYLPGHHSVLLLNCPNEQAAKDIGRVIMEKKMAASINILPKTSTMYYWKGEIQDATEILMLVKTKTSRIQKIMEYVRSVHPYENPELLSFLVEEGSVSYMKWMDEAIPDD